MLVYYKRESDMSEAFIKGVLKNNFEDIWTFPFNQNKLNIKNKQQNKEEVGKRSKDENKDPLPSEIEEEKEKDTIHQDIRIKLH